MTGAIDVIRCEISKYRGLAAFLALKYMNMGFPMYATLTNISIDNLSTVKGLSYLMRYRMRRAVAVRILVDGVTQWGRS